MSWAIGARSGVYGVLAEALNRATEAGSPLRMRGEQDMTRPPISQR